MFSWFWVRLRQENGFRVLLDVHEMAEIMPKKTYPNSLYKLPQ